MKIFLSLLCTTLCGFIAYAQGTALYPFKAYNGKYGYMNATGKVVVKAKFQRALEFSEGLAAVKVNRTWGYIDTTGKFKIEPNFADCGPFTNNRAIVTNKEEQEVYIDKHGNVIPIQLKQYYKLNDFREDMAVINTKDGKGYIDTSGNVVVPPQYQIAHDFHDGLALVSYGSMNGYINKSGDIIIDSKYIKATDFSNQIAAVKDDGYKTKFINTEGDVVLEIDAAFNCDNFHGALAKYYDEKQYGDGFVNKKGELVIAPVKHRNVMDFENGYAIFMANNSSGLLDKKGKVLFKKNSEVYVIQKVTQDLVLFLEKHPEDYSKSLYGFMDLAGNIVIEAKYKEARAFENGIARVRLPRKGYQYIDSTGKAIHPKVPPMEVGGRY